MNGPSFTLTAPAAVRPGEDFFVVIDASPGDDGPLETISLEQRDKGIIAQDELGGGGVTYPVSVVAPQSGSMFFRGEVNGFSGPWFEVRVSASAPPAVTPAILTNPPPQIPIVDTAAPPPQTAGMPTGHAPTVQLSMPSSVFAGQVFNIGASVRDLDGDISHVTLRWKDHGPVATYDLTGRGDGASVGWDGIVAPASGPIFFRYEVTDISGNGVTGDWQQINVIEKPAPSAEIIDRWVRVVKNPISATQFINVLQVLPGAPAPIPEAAEFANQYSANFGSADPQSLYNFFDQTLIRMSAELEAAGTNVAPVIAPTNTVGQTTIVAYQGTTPVYQQVQANGTVVQFVEGQTGVVVPTFGTYVAPVINPAPVNPATGEQQQSGSGGNGGVAATFDPTHRLVGWDGAGNEVYQINTDEVGRIVEWSVLSGHDSREVVPGTLHFLVGGEVTHVTSHTPPGTPAVTGSQSSNTALIVGALGVGAWLWARGRKR